jgi:hypothetical protein
VGGGVLTAFAVAGPVCLLHGLSDKRGSDPGEGIGLEGSGGGGQIG